MPRKKPGARKSKTASSSVLTSVARGVGSTLGVIAAKATSVIEGVEGVIETAQAKPAASPTRKSTKAAAKKTSFRGGYHKAASKKRGSTKAPRKKTR